MTVALGVVAVAVIVVVIAAPVVGTAGRQGRVVAQLVYCPWVRRVQDRRWN